MDTNSSEYYGAQIYDYLLGIFSDDDDMPDMKLDLDRIDATAFFTGAFMALALLFCKLTGEEKNFLEMTYIFNQLIVQHMKEREE